MVLGLSFRTQQTLNALKDEMKLKELEIKGTETSTAVLRKEVKNSNNELSKQREIIYNLVSSKIINRAQELIVVLLAGLPD